MTNEEAMLMNNRDNNCRFADICEELYGETMECKGVDKCISPYNEFYQGEEEYNERKAVEE